ncbi:MAG: peptidoglycan bridge formation glycyltransferase FemA/FemB family protein [Candidatus Daviesbacteria bacterium]|nr:peptidoglycan bridge formation glycyltransferase FemA/FemB family protein [Candidatus Daviesbacteria bacterium]
MDLREITEKEKNIYNKSVSHLMQSWAWGQFRKSLDTKLKRYGLFENNQLVTAFQITFHKIPLTKYFVGYLPKGPFPDKNLAKALTQIGKENNCAFIKIEPDVIAIRQLPEKQSETEIASSSGSAGAPRNDNTLISKKFKPSPKPLFTKFNYVLDLTKSEDEILQNMHQKFRYNIKVAKKHEVIIKEGTDDQLFADYIKLYFDTTKRQGYHGHNMSYHKSVWQSLKKENMVRVLVAYYEKIPLTAWMLINFKDTLYYPYGGSSELHRNVMSSNLLAWDAIRLGKKLGLKKFDLWGAADLSKGEKDSYFGFTKFKGGLGAELIEYIGTYDLILNWPIYILFNIVEKFMPLKLLLLRLINEV